MYTCPECKNKISRTHSLSNPCSQCGFLYPIKNSIEYCEEIAELLNKQIGAKISSFSPFRLNRKSHACSEPKIKIVSVEVVDKASLYKDYYEDKKGYACSIALECLECGETFKEIDGEKILRRIYPQEN